jgi:hypothetical protein
LCGVGNRRNADDNASDQTRHHGGRFLLEVGSCIIEFGESERNKMTKNGRQLHYDSIIAESASRGSSLLAKSASFAGTVPTLGRFARKTRADRPF